MFFSLQGTTSEYKVEVKDGNKEVNETIKIDTGKKTETVHISSGGRGAGKVDVLFDFKQVSNWEELTQEEIIELICFKAYLKVHKRSI